MSKSFNPIYKYPTEGTGFFGGKIYGEKRLKDIKNAAHADYGGWWPTFFPTAIGFLVTGSKEKPNVMTISCMVVVNAHPFKVGMPVFNSDWSPRGTGCRYSWELLNKNPEFTLNIPLIDPEMTKRVIICGTLSGREGIDKITKAGFTPLASCHVGPPILKECPINLECKVESTASMGTHSWVVGNVLAVYQDEDLAVGRRQLIWRSMPEYCSVSEAD